MPQPKFTEQQIFDVQNHVSKFISFKVTRPSQFQFTAGQFARLGLHQNDGQEIWRAYSMLNSPDADFLEFFAIIVPHGKFSQLLRNINNDAKILLGRQVFGFLTLGRFSDGENLWLLSTGTGIAPFLSILQDKIVWQQFNRINLVYSVRYAQDFAYQDLIHNLIAKNAPKLRYFPVISGENSTNILNGRITTVLQNGELEQVANCQLTLENSRIMLCGNPSMVQDCLSLLKERGMSLALARKPGQIAAENYW